MTANRHLAILCAITLVVVVAAGFATLQRRALTIDPPPAARMFHNLAERFGDIAEVTVARAVEGAMVGVNARLSKLSEQVSSIEATLAAGEAKPQGTFRAVGALGTLSESFGLSKPQRSQR